MFAVAQLFPLQKQSYCNPPTSLHSALEAKPTVNMAALKIVFIVLAMSLTNVIADAAPAAHAVTITQRAEASPSNWAGFIGSGTVDSTSTNDCK
jgi:hypothetical protein